MKKKSFIKILSIAIELPNFRGVGVVKWKGEVEETEEGSVLYVGIRCYFKCFIFYCSSVPI